MQNDAKIVILAEKQEMVATVAQVHSVVPEIERLKLPVVTEADAKTAITEKITAGPITEDNPTNPQDLQDLQDPPTTADLKGPSSRLDPPPDPQNPQEITVAIMVTIAAITAATTDDQAALEITDDQMVNWV